MPEVVLVYDDINLPFGRIRLSPKGGAGMTMFSSLNKATLSSVL